MLKQQIFTDMDGKYPTPMVTISLEEYNTLKISAGKAGEVCSVRYKNSLEDISSFLVSSRDPRIIVRPDDMISAMRDSFERNEIAYNYGVNNSLSLSDK
jgi:hypothetical protein